MLFEMTVPAFIKSLSNLSAILDKGAAFADSRKIEMEVLLNSRLFPDQLPLGRQIHIACDAAKLGVARLTGKDAPKNDDTEKTWPEFKARIESTIAYLKTIKPEDFKDAATVKVTQPRWEGKYLFGTEYTLDHVIPNVYFHVTTAYSILRHNGVDVGKKDYLGAMNYKN